MQRRYVTVDVFTSQRFGGNPLAVVLDAEGMDTAAMQAVAREFNYSETTFVLPPQDPAHTAHVRIFTPAREIPFAGHPNVGTAYVVATEGHGGPRVVFEEAAGLVAVDILREGGTIVGGELTAPQPLETGAALPVAAAAAILSLTPAEIATARHQPVLASVGLPFVVAEITTREALRRARLHLPAYGEHFPFHDAVGLYFYTRDGGGFDLHSRMVTPLFEDPATGSATVATAALLASLGPDGESTLRIEQGRDMGRPSTLLTRTLTAGGMVRSAHVGGRCVSVMRGTVTA